MISQMINRSYPIVGLMLNDVDIYSQACFCAKKAQAQITVKRKQREPMMCFYYTTGGFASLSFTAKSEGGIFPACSLAYAAVNSAPKNMIIEE